MIDAGQIDLSEYITKEKLKEYLLAQPEWYGDTLWQTVNKAHLNKEKTIWLVVNASSGLELARELAKEVDSPEKIAVIIASVINRVKLEFYWYSKKIAVRDTDQELAQKAGRYRASVQRLFEELKQEGIISEHYKTILEPIYSIERDI
jgi:CRP-like cAMP-binding protein